MNKLLNEQLDEFEKLFESFNKEKEKACRGMKAPLQRMRMTMLALQKLGKQFRKEAKKWERDN